MRQTSSSLRVIVVCLIAFLASVAACGKKPEASLPHPSTSQPAAAPSPDKVRSAQALAAPPLTHEKIEAVAMDVACIETKEKDEALRSSLVATRLGEAKLTRTAYDDALATLAPGFAEVAKRSTAECAYLPGKGIVSETDRKRYREALIAISCAQKERGPDGKPIAAQSKTIEILGAHAFDPQMFATLGQALAPARQFIADLHAERARRCPDKRQSDGDRAGNSVYEGTLDGRAAANLRIVVKKGSIVDGAVKMGERSLKTTGAYDGDRAFISAVEGDEWLRLQGEPALKGGGAEGARGKYEGFFLTLKKVKGTWTMKRVGDTPADAPDPPPALPPPAKD